MNQIPENILITGGAGFIGTHLVDYFLSEGKKITLLDNFSNANKEWINNRMDKKNLTIIKGDITDQSILKNAMKGNRQVWHLAGNANIPLGYRNTNIDLDSAVVGTRNILDAMRGEGIKDIVFTSSGSVYGKLAEDIEVKESMGPLMPLSLYAAGKLAAEGFISAYCNLFDLRGYIFRFGNVLGSRMSRGIIRDFIMKLQESTESLMILGDGKQKKSYFLVEDCIEGMVQVVNHGNDKSVDIINLGHSQLISIMEIADIIVQELGLKNVTYQYTNKEAWPGDQPIVQLNVSKVWEKYHWKVERTPQKTVREATRRMIEYLKVK